MKASEFIIEGSNTNLENAVNKMVYGYLHGRSIEKNTCYSYVGQELARIKPDRATIRFWGRKPKLIVHGDAVLPDGKVISTTPPDLYDKFGYEIVDTLPLKDLLARASSDAKLNESDTSVGDRIQSQLGLKSFVVFARGDDLELDSLIVGKDKQGQGLGTKAMKILTDYADTHSKRIILTPGLQDKIQGTTSRSRLVKFYKQFGFKESKGRNIDYALGAGKMYREPKLDEMALPADWEEGALGADQTFKNRLQYALERAKKLGTGSSRVAFTIELEGRPTVLKVAKNRKGVAQNEAEVSVLDDGYLGRLDIVIPLIDYDQKNPSPLWIQTELAKKVNVKRLAELLHCNDFWEFLDCVDGIINPKSRSRAIWGQNGPTEVKIEPSNLEKTKQRLLANGKSEQDVELFVEYVDDTVNLLHNSEVVFADLRQPANWGEYQGRPVIIDLGFTEAVRHLYQRGNR